MTITSRLLTPVLPRAAPPAAGRHTAVQAYATVLLLYVFAGGAPVPESFAIFMKLDGGAAPAALRTAAVAGHLIGLAGAALWLMILLLARARRTFTRPWRVLTLLTGGVCVVIADECGFFSQGHGSTQVVGHLVEVPLWIWLCLEVTTRQGVPLRHLSSPRPLNWRTAVQWARCTGWALTYVVHLLALVGGVLLSWVLAFLPGPVLKGDQGAAAGAPDVGRGLVQGIWSATVEELLVTAVVVVVLTAVRRPVWETLAVVAVMRVLPHAYIGLWPMFAAVVPAVAAGWLYHRYQRVIPLILAHALFDTAGALHGSALGYVVLVTMVLLAWSSLFIVWPSEASPGKAEPGHPEPVSAGPSVGGNATP